MASQEDENKIHVASAFGEDGMSLQHGREQTGEAYSEPRQNMPVPADRDNLGAGGGLLASPQTLQAHSGGVWGVDEGGWATENTRATSSASHGVASISPFYTPQSGGPYANGQDPYLPTSFLAQTSQSQATQPQTVHQPMTPLEQRLLAQLNEHSQSSNQVTSGLVGLQGYAPVEPRPPPWAPMGSMSSPGIYRPSGLQLHAATYYFDPYPADRDPLDMNDEVREDWTEFERKWDQDMEDAKYTSDDLWCDGSTLLWFLARLYGDGEGKR
ncbi:hypothetical protein KC332_g1318 [Hortaea werneckii]|nr:hypothetical protein KC358_g663 [Hortaea werneckii]KAI6852660.1 hypothetical protein KC350_g699 [Hortaea werneckii]KAI6943797.1 hypothetical protein KC341_g1264 [Hortaea werneckii]KAI6950421.1 hypothetical protein KC348_g694 [Hortaea werneckii]KAI6982589.1 hypothetical protein KC321_g555 [Hortaea werneckii]